jgi:hypothetical protein
VSQGRAPLSQPKVRKILDTTFHLGFPQVVVIGLCVASVMPIVVIDGGMVRSLLLRYVWNQPDAARIGPLLDDEYMSR